MTETRTSRRRPEMSHARSARALCFHRYKNADGKTCRQIAREYFDSWCMACCDRWDHEHGKHESDPHEGCDRCHPELRIPGEVRTQVDKRSRTKVGASLPAHRSRGPLSSGIRSRGRVPGTNGSWPAAGEEPKPPAICNLVEDLVDPEDLPQSVYGQYPKGFLRRLLPYLRCARSEILHVCSGSLPPGEGTRVDIRPEAKPDILADGRDLPFADGEWTGAILIDPPYTEQYARDLYGVEYPRPSHLLTEAARVAAPCSRIALVHYIVPPRIPPGCTLEKVFGLSTGMGFSMRAVTLFVKEQSRLL